MTTIGYARKSQTPGDSETRTRLLQLMIHCLQLQGHCTKIFVSPYCGANQNLNERDLTQQDDVLEKLEDCHGTCRGIVLP